MFKLYQIRGNLNNPLENRDSHPVESYGKVLIVSDESFTTSGKQNSFPTNSAESFMGGGQTAFRGNKTSLKRKENGTFCHRRGKQKRKCN